MSHLCMIAASVGQSVGFLKRDLCPTGQSSETHGGYIEDLRHSMRKAVNPLSAAIDRPLLGVAEVGVSRPAIDLGLY